MRIPGDEASKLTKRIGIAGALLCIGVALVAYRYFSPSAPVPEVIAGNTFRAGWLVAHALTAATALLVVPWQLWPQQRARRPGLHRWTGRVYVVACLAAGATGLVLAFGAATGPVSTAGFGLLSIAWMYTTAMGWRMALRRDFTAHRRWMIRSFALTFAAVTLRLYVPVAVALPIDFADGYRAISFLCWVPNLLVAELWLRRERGGFAAALQAARFSGLGRPTA